MGVSSSTASGLVSHWRLTVWQQWSIVDGLFGADANIAPKRSHLILLLIDRGSTHWIRVGSIAGIASAFLYTAANVQLRRAVSVDPFLVAAVKALPTVVGLTPVVLWYLFAGKPLGTNYSLLPRFALVALIGQFVGNAAFQVALGHIALAVAVPITLGTLIVGGGALGWFLLGEPISRGKWMAMAVLITAVVVLSTGENGTNATSRSSGDETEPIVWFGAACAIASGAAYSLFGVITRRTLNNGLSMPATMMTSGLVGAISLWSFCLIRLGPDAVLAIRSDQWITMAWAGTFNFAAFVALSASLKFLPVVAVNLINASQVAMAAIAGVYFFNESLNPSVATGIALTVIGLLVLTASSNRRRSKKE